MDVTILERIINQRETHFPEQVIIGLNKSIIYGRHEKWRTQTANSSLNFLNAYYEMLIFLAQYSSKSFICSKVVKYCKKGTLHMSYAWPDPHALAISKAYWNDGSRISPVRFRNLVNFQMESYFRFPNWESWNILVYCIHFVKSMMDPIFNMRMIQMSIAWPNFENDWAECNWPVCYISFVPNYWIHLIGIWTQVR